MDLVSWPCDADHLPQGEIRPGKVFKRHVGIRQVYGVIVQGQWLRTCVDSEELDGGAAIGTPILKVRCDGFVAERG